MPPSKTRPLELIVQKANSVALLQKFSYVRSGGFIGFWRRFSDCDFHDRLQIHSLLTSSLKAEISLRNWLKAEASLCFLHVVCSVHSFKL